MNELIRKLAEQAGSTHKQNLGVYQFYESELQEFAQSIIQECIDIVSYGGEFASRPKLVEKLKTHFGVKDE